MMFFRVASVPLKVIGDFGDYSRKIRVIASVLGKQGNKEKNLIDPKKFERVTGIYAISPDPTDYGFLSALAVRANIPNNNGDAISTEELFRFRPHRGCQTFETFINAPLHLNHFSSEPKLARGFVVDSIYNKWDEPFEFVEVVVAVDKKKDPYLADGLLSGKINKFSMGSLVEAIKCSLSNCGKIAHSEQELCEHLKKMRMQTVNGEMVFGWNIGVDYEELSVVERPAENFATTRKIFGGLPSHLASFVNSLPGARKVAFQRFANKYIVLADLLDLGDKDREIIKEFLSVYRGRIPGVVEATLRRVLDEKL